MSKSHKKKQRQRQAPTAIYRPTDTTPVQKHTDYLFSQSSDMPANAISHKRAAFLTAVLFSAKSLGYIPPKTQTRIIKGEITSLYVDLPTLWEQLQYAAILSEPRKSREASSVVWTVNKRNEDIPAIPEPLYGLKKQCSCGKSFWKLKNYQAHYAHKHIVLGEQPL